MKELSLTAKYLPSFDVRDHHETRVRAAPDAAYAELRRLDLGRSWLVRVIFGVRTRLFFGLGIRLIRRLALGWMRRELAHR